MTNPLSAVPGPGSGGVGMAPRAASQGAAPPKMPDLTPAKRPPVVPGPGQNPAMGQFPFANLLGQAAGNMPTIMGGLLSVPGINQAARGALSVGGAPLMLGLADMGNNFQNFKTLTQGAWKK